MNTYEKSDTLIRWKLYQYRSPSGRLAINDWRKALPAGPARADLDTFLRDMSKKDQWKYPDIDQLKGEDYKEFTELRWKSCKLQHRIFGRQIGDHEYLMLTGCTHKDDIYNPSGVWESLVERNNKLKREEATYIEYPIIVSG